MVQNAAVDFFTHGNLLKAFNKTQIVLIPKTPCPEEVGNFRPISLCNYAYKILAKVIANRLKPLLPDLVSPFQNAFVGDRQIQDNVLIAHEVFHHLKLKNSTKHFEMGIKLDMNKAYDRIEWDFLKAVLLKFGFNTSWVALIMECITTVTFSVVLNGKAGKIFQPTRGLRQGDPLSPYLFILISEALSHMISAKCRSSDLQGIQIGNGPMISHLFFADDSLLFLKATQQNCTNIRDTLNMYYKASGQAINFEKSNIFFSPNTPTSLRLMLSDSLGIKATDNPGKYLGIPWYADSLGTLKERGLGLCQRENCKKKFGLEEL